MMVGILWRGDKTVFAVTGGGSGIGRALAQALAARGFEVLIIGRREAPLHETAAGFRTIRTLVADVASAAGREKAVSALKGCSLSGLVHNAGTIHPIQSIETIRETDWHAAFATNLDAPLFLTQSLLPQLTGAKVLNIGTAAAYFAVRGWSAYCVSKAALSMLTRCWQEECRSTAFASVMPGIIDTDMQAIIRDALHMAPEKLEFFRRLKAQGQLLTPEVVADFLVFLLLEVKPDEYVSCEWDIYDKTHHPRWLVSPKRVPELD